MRGTGREGQQARRYTGLWVFRLTQHACAPVQYPVTATQWHPEKNAFEWPQHLNIPHSSQAVR